MSDEYEGEIPWIFSEMHRAIIARSNARTAREVLALADHYKDKSNGTDPTQAQAQTGALIAATQMARTARTILENRAITPSQGTEGEGRDALTWQISKTAWTELLEFDRSRLERDELPLSPPNERDRAKGAEKTELWYAAVFQSMARESEQGTLTEEWDDIADDEHDGQEELQEHLMQAITQIAEAHYLADIREWPFEGDPISNLTQEDLEGDEDTENRTTLQGRAQDSQSELVDTDETMRPWFMQRLGVIISPKIKDKDDARTRAEESTVVLSSCEIWMITDGNRMPETTVAFLHRGNIHVKPIDEAYPPGVPAYVMQNHLKMAHRELSMQNLIGLPTRQTDATLKKLNRVLMKTMDSKFRPS